MSVRRKTSRAVTAVVTATVMLGTLTTGTASASTPGVGGVGGVNVRYFGDDTDAGTLTKVAVDLAAQCVAPDGLCTTALGTATNAVEVAVACARAMASEAGVRPEVVLAMQRVNLDCAGVVRLSMALAQFAVSVANECTREQIGTCRTVFEAARLGMDRARGCLSAVLPASESDYVGTDPGCASALAMLWRQAEGVIAMLTGCIYGSDTLCQQAQEHAKFAVDGLTGCVGQVLWVAPSQVHPIVPGGGPLPCYAVLDQVVVSTNALLGQLSFPTQITPTDSPEECSITVAAALPSVQLSDPSLTTRYSPEPFLPSCDEPESLHTVSDAETPGLSNGVVPSCEGGHAYVVDKEKRDGKKFDWHKIFGNRNSAKPIPWKVEYTHESELGAKITVGAEAELNIWLKKIKAEVNVEASISRRWTHTINIHPEVAAGREGHVASIVFTKVVEGRHITRYDDCKIKTEFRRIRAPYKDYWDYWEEPYTGE